MSIHCAEILFVCSAGCLYHTLTLLLKYVCNFDVRNLFFKNDKRKLIILK